MPFRTRNHIGQRGMFPKLIFSYAQECEVIGSYKRPSVGAISTCFLALNVVIFLQVFVDCRLDTDHMSSLSVLSQKSR
jgi:hypothetical protein